MYYLGNTDLPKLVPITVPLVVGTLNTGTY
eukprot:SAG11_NODE_16312_length_551_cov_0.767699_2_plen_29_part_01